MQGGTKPKRRVFKKTVNEYAAASSAHGIAYIFEPDRLFIERLFWILVVGIAFGYRYEFYTMFIIRQSFDIEFKLDIEIIHLHISLYSS